MLLITIYEMSNASRWHPVAKSHQDHQSSLREQLQTLVTFQGVACVSSNQRRRMVWLTVASQCVQIARLADFPTSFSFYSCVTMDGNPAFTAHATAHAFRGAINLYSMLLRQHIWCFRKLFNLWSFDKLHVEMDLMCSEGNCDDFYLWDV